MDLRSNLGKARGLGSAKDGVHHWWMQRVTAVALIPLVLWFVSSVIKATGYHGIEGVIYLLSSPFNALAMILFLGTAIYHGTLGVKVIIEDYVHCRCASTFLDIFTKFIAVISIVAVTFAIFYVHINTYGNSGKYNAGFWKAQNYNKKQEGAPESGNASKMEDIQENEGGAAPMIEVETPKE